ncbi:MAG: VTT domain-containing protein [Rhodospirillales bacterium]
MQDATDRIIEEGSNCWLKAKAGRAAIIIDPAPYYAALRESLKAARATIFIAGWDVDSRTPLYGPDGPPDDGYPDTLGPFLTTLADERPDLRIHILLWDYSMLYALEREPIPSIQLDWMTPANIKVCLDDVLPVGASHHQKIVTIDDCIAYSGGIDLTIRRWDSPDHRIDNPDRRDPLGEIYRPFHDIQMAVDCDAAAALARMVRRRWLRAACDRPPKLSPGEDCWPVGLDPDFEDVDIAIARTFPPMEGRPGIHEVEQLFCDSIIRAEHCIYIENQFLTADSIANSLIECLAEKPDLEVLIIAPNVHQSWLEERSMNVGRIRFMRKLSDNGLDDRVRLVYPAIPDDPTGEGVMVHAKLMIVDDRLIRVGSANINNRSMRTDTECDLAIEAQSGADRKQIAEIRHRLLAEHLGCDATDIKAAVEEHGLIAAIDRFQDGEKSLKPVEIGTMPDEQVADAVRSIADPETPIATPDFVGDMFSARATTRSRRRLLKPLLLVLAIAVLVAVWRLTPLAQMTSPSDLAAQLEHFSDTAWLPVIIPAAYIIGGFVMFPVTVMIAVTGLLLDPLSACLYALTGAMMSAAATFGIGQFAGRDIMRNLLGITINRLSRRLAQRGILSVAALRMLPVAPFTLINLVAGASHIRFTDYMAGTLLGMGPGIVLMTLLGHQIGAMLSDPTPVEMALFAAALLGWLALSFLLQMLAEKLRNA